MSDRKPLKFVSPRVILIYPKLNAPDTKFKPEGEFRAKGKLLPANMPPELLAKLTALRDEFAAETKAELTKDKKGAKAKSLKLRDILQEETDKDSGEATGFVTISAKMVASGISKKTKQPWKREPKLFDAAGKKLSLKTRIWGGSEAKLSIEALPYYTPKDNEVGVAFYLSAVQVLKLVSGGGDNAADHGFGAEEGYTGEDEAGDEGFTPDTGSTTGEKKAGDDF